MSNPAKRAAEILREEAENLLRPMEPQRRKDLLSLAESLERCVVVPRAMLWAGTPGKCNQYGQRGDVMLNTPTKRDAAKREEA